MIATDEYTRLTRLIALTPPGERRAQYEAQLNQIATKPSGNGKLTALYAERDRLLARWNKGLDFLAGLRERTRRAGQHARLPESIASLYVGLDLGLTFAVEIGALTAHAADNLRAEGWAVLGDIAERQRAHTEEQRPTWRFLTVIAELVAQGKARLDHTNQLDFIGDGERLGWYDENYLYLLPSASYHLVARYERDEGRIFGVKENALRKMLAEEGLSFVSDKAHYTARVRVAGEQPRVLKIAKAHAKKVSGVSFEKPGTVGTDA
jgi:hypothetical protein